MAGSLTPKPKPNKAAAPELSNPAGTGAANPALPALAAFSQTLSWPLAIAYSGGADSTALLLAACSLRPGQVSAIHVHHGLQAAADAFEAHCSAVCALLGVHLHIARVDARHHSGESPEDAARKARYSALAEGARALGQSQVLLGQHADDQVETLLLALSRGAGLAGLSAMPAAFERDGVEFLRPLLAVPGPALRQWLLQQGHAFVDDPSNTDERYTRNRIRARLLPALAEAFPQFRQTFARSASHAAEAQTLLSEMAAQDLLLVGTPPAIAALQALSRPRQSNVLRHWLLGSHQARPSAAQLAQLLDQIAVCTTRGHQIHLKVAHGHVLRQGHQLAWQGSI
jgi:tRNA(Ile)-lysidine synthase